MSRALSCHQLFKRYDSGRSSVEALQGLDLTVDRGECFGLLGPNGAGKTTTVEILQGLLQPTSGEVEVLGHRWGVGRDQELRERLGVTLQETRLRDKLTVLETLRLFRSFYQDGIEPEEAMALVALEDKATSWVVKLSGGQRQRLAVACALIGKPELLFLDEPTTGLDPQARRQLWEVVTGLKRQGNTILLTTHYMDEAEKLCDRVAIIDHGQVIAEGSPKVLIAQMGGEHVIDFSLASNGPRGGAFRELLSGVDDVSQVTEESGHYLLTVSEPHRSIPALLELLRREQMTLESLTTRHVNLEDVFVNLTGRHLRDD
jgi:ABC-2 type transport system ATP-binding protein